MPFSLVAMMALALGGLSSGSDPAEIVGSDVGWDLHVTNAGPEVLRTCLQASGLPAWVKGAYYISGPARFDIGGYHFKSFFDGPGRINKFELQRGEVCFSSRWLTTGSFLESERTHLPAPSVMFEDTTPEMPSCPLTNPMCKLLGPNDNNWINMINVGGEGVLLSDTMNMVTMDLETLNVSGKKQWSDDAQSMMGTLTAPTWVTPMHVATIGSAHPLNRPGTSTWVNVVTEMAVLPFSSSYVDIYSFDAASSAPQPRKLIAKLQTDASQYFHSFGVTPNYVVLPFNMEMKMPAMVGTPTLIENFQSSWKGIHLVDLMGREQVFETDPFYHAHIVNSFENGTGVVLDIGAYERMPFTKEIVDTAAFLDKSARDNSTNKGFVRRLHMHTSGPRQGMTTVEDFGMPGRGLDFQTINQAFSGKPYCTYYAVEWWHDGATKASMAILKHDMCEGSRTYWSRPFTYPAEPFFVPREGSTAEDDGVLIFIAIDGVRGHSIFVVLDARTFEELEVVDLPVHIPFTAHGNFFAAPSSEYV